MTAIVVHLSSVHPPYDVRIFAKECTTLAEAGYRVSYIAPHDRNERIDGVEIVPLKPSRGRLARILTGPWRVLAAARRANGDIYHLHDPELIPVAIALKLLGKRVVFDVHEDLRAQIMSKPWIPSVLRPPVGWLTALAQKFAGRWLDAFVAATPRIAAGLAGCEVVTVQNYPKKNELSVDRRENVDQRKAAFVYVGGITRIRGAREMVEAISRVPEKYEPELWLAGAFESDELRRELESHPGWSRTHYFGQVDRDGVRMLLTGARAGLVLLQPVPNYLESYPTKMFEYMSAGLPSIASNFDFWLKMPKLQGCVEFVDPRDAGQIAAAMQSILDNPGAANAMGRNGQQQIETRLNWENEAQKLLQLYAQISRRARIAGNTAR